MFHHDMNTGRFQDVQGHLKMLARGQQRTTKQAVKKVSCTTKLQTTQRHCERASRPSVT